MHDKKFKLQTVKTALEIGIIKAAQLYQLNRKTVSGWLKDYNQSEDKIADKPQRRRNCCRAGEMSVDEELKLAEILSQNPRISARELKEKFGFQQSASAICKKKKKLLNPQNQAVPALNFTIYYRRFIPAESCIESLPAFLLLAIEKESGICFAAFAEENNQHNLAIFCDYLLYNLSGLKELLQDITISLAKSFQHDKTIRAIVADKYGQQLTSNREPGLFPKNILAVKAQSCSEFLTGMLARNLNSLITGQTTKIGVQQLIDWPILLTDSLLCHYLKNGKAADFWVKEIPADSKLISAARERAVGLAESLVKTGDLASAEFIYSSLLTLQTPLPEYQLQQTLLHRLAQLKIKNGQTEESVKLYTKSLKLATENSDRAAMLKIYGHWGVLLYNTGANKQADKLLKKQLQMAVELADIAGQTTAYQSLGALAARQNKHLKAASFYEKVLLLVETSGNLVAKAKALGNLGVLFYKQGRLTRARHYYEEAIFLAERVNDQRQAARLYGNLGVIYDEQKKYQQALKSYQQMYDLAVLLKNEQYQAAAASNLGNLQLNQGDYANALLRFDFFLTISLKYKDQENAAIAYANLAEVHKGLQNYTLAKEYLSRAIRLGIRLELKYYLCSFYHQLAELHFIEKRWKSALKYNSLCRALSKEMSRHDLTIPGDLLFYKIQIAAGELNSEQKQEIVASLQTLLMQTTDKTEQSEIRDELNRLKRAIISTKA